MLRKSQGPPSTVFDVSEYLKPGRLPCYKGRPFTGYCPGIPSLRHGEDRLAGLVLHPLLVQVRDSCIDSWLLWAESAGKVKQRNGKYVATGKLKAEDSVWLPEDQEQELLHSFSRHQLQQLTRDIAAALGITDAHPLAPVAQDPPTNPTLEPFTIGTLPDGSSDPHEPRKGLIGQRGLRARQLLRQLAYVGVYRAYCCPAEVYQRALLAPPEDFPGDVMDWSMALESYCLDDIVMDQEAASNRRGLHLKMMISALGYGNETALVNDPAREDVMDPVMGEARHAKYADQANVTLITVVVRNFRIPVLISVADIPQGAEATYDYGYSYWENLQSKVALQGALRGEREALLQRRLAQQDLAGAAGSGQGQQQEQQAAAAGSCGQLPMRTPQGGSDQRGQQQQQWEEEEEEQQQQVAAQQAGKLGAIRQAAHGSGSSRGDLQQASQLLRQQQQVLEQQEARIEELEARCSQQHQELAQQQQQQQQQQQPSELEATYVAAMDRQAVRLQQRHQETLRLKGQQWQQGLAAVHEEHAQHVAELEASHSRQQQQLVQHWQQECRVKQLAFDTKAQQLSAALASFQREQEQQRVQHEQQLLLQKHAALQQAQQLRARLAERDLQLAALKAEQQQEVAGRQQLAAALAAHLCEVKKLQQALEAQLTDQAQQQQQQQQQGRHVQAEASSSSSSGASEQAALPRHTSSELEASMALLRQQLRSLHIRISRVPELAAAAGAAAPQAQQQQQEQEAVETQQRPEPGQEQPVQQPVLQQQQHQGGADQEPAAVCIPAHEPMQQLQAELHLEHVRSQAAGPPDQVAQQQQDATAEHGQLPSSPRPAKRLRPEGCVGLAAACRSPVCCLQGQSCALCSCCEA